MIYTFSTQLVGLFNGVWNVICIFTAVIEYSIYLPFVWCVIQLMDSLRSDLGFDIASFPVQLLPVVF